MEWYGRLIDDGLKVERSVRGGESSVIPGVGKVTSDMSWPIRSGAPSGLPSKSVSSRKFLSKDPVASEKAMEERARVDRRLRKIARDIKSWYSGGAFSSNRICDGQCKKIGDGEWNYCPRCGGRMREMDGRRNG